MTPSLKATVFAACALLPLATLSAGVEQRREVVPVGHPNNPETWYLLAESLSEQSKDSTLTPDGAKALVLRSLEATEQALKLNPVYYNALNLKAALLRQRAISEKDPSVRKKLIAEAEVVSRKAAEIAERREKV